MAIMEPIKEVGDEEEEEEVVGQVSHTVNGDITLSQQELCVIYTWEHWISRSKDNGKNYVDIKRIVGHSMLELDDDMYDRLDLQDVIDRFHDESDSLTSDVKIPAEQHRNRWVTWTPQLHKKYLRKCHDNKESVAL